MNKKYCLYVVLLFTLFLPKVYAFTYDINTEVSDTSVKLGTEIEIKVSLSNIQGTDDGISFCSLNMLFEENVLLNSKIETIGSWSMTTGKVYLFNTSESIINDSEMFIIPVKVDGEGTVKLVDIVCSDGKSDAILNDKSLSFTIDNDDIDEVNDSEQDSDDLVVSSNCDLSDIKLSEGTIDFDSSITEYSLKVTSFDNLVIEPELADNDSSFVIEKNDNNVVITVTAKDGTRKQYTILVSEVSSSELKKDNIGNNMYIPIFIVIICVLILINLIRIIKNRKK